VVVSEHCAGAGGDNPAIGRVRADTQLVQVRSPTVDVSVLILAGSATVMDEPCETETSSELWRMQRKVVTYIGNNNRRKAKQAG
jgi:hypothetical protein